MPTLVLTDAVKNVLTDALAGVGLWLSIHTANPTTSGGFEATGGSPAYARKLLAFNASGAIGPLGGGVQPATVGIAWSTQVIFDLPAGTYPYWGLWTASSGGTFRYARDFGTARVLGSQDLLPLAIGLGAPAGA